MTTSEITHFQSIPWVSHLLDDPSYTSVPIRTRGPSIKLSADDYFFTRTLNTPTTISFCLMQFKNPHPGSPIHTPPSEPVHELRVFFTVGEDVMGPPGSMHGGATASLLDECMGLLLTSGGWFKSLFNAEKTHFCGPVTAYLNTTYLRRVPTPGTIVVYACVKEVVDLRKWKVEAEIRDGEGNVCSRAECLFVKLEAKI
ncbi:hypothetical protein FE257_012290 [Aspergillus nanangensis]|uniref:Thioesterase domain-containing protein n=1 Tax=Aspergillus nanangensis TaxID=2582783 RepID=A0AAD4CG20_ASPNN|nr:hypothetical protein FE257_012290 [Aspergillus nanangensis]